MAGLLGVFGLAFFSFWTSIPAGLALQLPPLLVALTAWVSYVAGAALIVLIGQPLRTRFMARFGGKISADSPIRRAWDRYGLIGLSALAPLTTGSQIGAAIGLSLGVSPPRLIAGMALGAAVWAAVITGLSLAGLAAVQGAQ